MDHKSIVAAVRMWEGVKMNWSLIIQQKMHEEIQVRRTHNPNVLHLQSTFFISCLGQNVNPIIDVMVARPLTLPLLTSPLSPTPPKAKMKNVASSSRIAELEGQLSETKDKME